LDRLKSDSRKKTLITAELFRPVPFIRSQTFYKAPPP